jgi:hypothetical protein
MRYLIFILVSLFFLQAADVLADPPNNYPFMRYDEGVRLAQAQKRPIFIYYGRFGCGF